MADRLSNAVFEQLFTSARTVYAWQDKAISESVLRELYETCRWAPTGANTNPMRVVFVASKEAKERLRPALSEGNVEKTVTAPVTAIIAEDHEFYEHMPFLFPHVPDARSWFAGNEESIRANAHYNTTLQAGYFIMAARALGLDCGPMAGFDKAVLDAAFFAGTSYKSNVLINLGYGDPEKLFPRNPRFEFEQVCKIV